MNDLRIARGFAPDEAPAIAALFWQAFGPKLGRLLGPEPAARAYLATVLQPEHAYVARRGDGPPLGFAGVKRGAAGLMAGGLRELHDAYGMLGTVWRAPLLDLMASEAAPGVVVLDGIGVANVARGQGIGTALIEALRQDGQDTGARELRLELVEDNLRARALYERLGFRAAGRHRLGLVAPLLGHRRTVVMVLPL
ncbi:MAG: GNAT family N-acetyltransferase [Celeribacter sp.]|jgi:ribosomal protein S18 acetylase RimI-like enzyme